MKNKALSGKGGWCRGVSADGTTGVGFVEAGKNRVAVVWDGLRSIRALPSLGKGTTLDEARRITPDKRAIVGHSKSSKGMQAVVWRDNGKPAPLPDLPGGEFYGEAWAVSANGSHIVGWSADGERWVPAAWRNGVVFKPGEMPTGAKRGMARAVSADGRVIGGLWGYGDQAIGFIWFAGSGATSIQNYLARNAYEQYSKEYRFQSAIGVSDDGRTIVGYYRHPTDKRNWGGGFVIKINRRP